ncbi:MAG TPA: glycosyltransferase [Gammaproteobacteria bacterium]|nr:glycosyltransferase [Gammaproteobacteria bacterium]
MHVLIIFSSSQLGGAERSLSRMALASDGVDYQLATLEGEGPWCDWVRSQDTNPLIFGRGYSRSFFASCWRLICHVRRNHVDVLYVCGSRASFFLRFMRLFVPKVKLVHAIRWNPDSNSRLDRFFRLMERFTHPLVDAWITNSAIAKQTLAEHCRISPSRIMVIYNGLRPLSKGVVPLNKRPMEVLTVANLSSRKGHREYLQVIREVVKAVPANVRFVFVGRDDMNGAVQHAIESAELAHFVRYEGFQTDVSSYFRHARVCVLPSLWGEGCPTSLLESFSWGVPAVAYDIDGVAELIEDGVNGFLVPSGDSELLADRIVTLLDEVELAERYGQAGLKKVREKFTLTQCVTEHARVFCGLKGCG